MTRTAAIKTYANFTGGLITEASELSYPENAAKDLDNVDINENGSIQRRAGLAYDGQNSINFPSLSNSLSLTAIQAYKWRSVNGISDRHIAVIQIGNKLYFYWLNDGEVLSNEAAPPITLTKADGTFHTDTEIAQEKVDFTTGQGYLFMCGKYIDPAVLEYTGSDTEWTVGTVSYTPYIIKVRDFKIVGLGEDVVVGSNTYSLAGEESQAFMSGAHFYNLANQGWPAEYNTGSTGMWQETDAVVSSTESGGAADDEPAAYTYSKIGKFPTIYNSFHAYQYGGGTSIREQTAYNPWFLENDYEFGTPAPRGKFIYPAFEIDRKAYGDGGVEGNSGPPNFNFHKEHYRDVDFTYKRPEAIAYYAGRIWYAGVEATGYTNKIYFSQVLQNSPDKAAFCYQEADPTAETINELVATDGGEISLEEVGRIYKILPIGYSLVIVADNGVWSLAGDGEQSSFRADSFSVRRVTNQGVISKDSIIFARDVLYYWAEGVINTVALDQTGFIVASDISSMKVKRKVLEINSESKDTVFTVFDAGANKIMWFYRSVEDGAYANNILNKVHNKVIYWDISLQSFGTYTISLQSDILPVSGFSIEPSATINIVEPITDGGVAVTDGGDPIVDTKTYFSPEASALRLLTVTGDVGTGYILRFSGFTDVQNFEDWGNDFTSYVETGFDSLQDIVGKSKKAPLLQTLFKRTEDSFDVSVNELVLTNQSGCNVSYGWDWATSPYSNQFQGYKLLRNYTPGASGEPFDYGVDVITTRNRLRGRGTSLGIRFESETNKDFFILGYGIVYTTRGRP